MYQLILGNKKHLLQHLLFWVSMLLFFSFAEWQRETSLWDAFCLESTYLPARLIGVYVSWFYIVPNFLYKNALIQYALALGLLLLSLAILQRFFSLYFAYPILFPEWMNTPPQPWNFFRIMQNLIIIAFPIAIATGWKLFQDWYHQLKRVNQLKMEKTEAELKYLRSQVNPHFLFNTLNNIYGLSREKSTKVPDLILQLSHILSFTLYESNVKTISLVKELSLIESFVKLEEDRFGDRVEVLLDFPTSIPSIKIAPLLLMPLVENAFKHGVKHEIGRAFVNIKASYQDACFLFEVSNSIARPKIHKRHNSGLGLKNLVRRLNLLYPQKHTLQLKQDHKAYSVILEIIYK